MPESVYHVAEGSLLTVTIHREGDASKQETVKYRTLDGTALVGDYNKLTNQDAVFAVGKTDVSFQVVINEDTLPEGNETFFIEIFQIMGKDFLFNFYFFLLLNEINCMN